jgi:hypothetical protein
MNKRTVLENLNEVLALIAEEQELFDLILNNSHLTEDELNEAISVEITDFEETDSLL